MKTTQEIARPLADVYILNQELVEQAGDFIVQELDLGTELFQQMLDGLASATVACHFASCARGWWDKDDPQDPHIFATKIALIHSEISEAMEGGRKGLMDDHLPHRRAEEVELADALIRIFDLAGARGLDVAGAAIEKIAYNLQRADHKVDARAAAGGKKF